MSGATTPAEQEIACQQVLTEDFSVFSIQWMTISQSLAAGVSPDLLLDRYLSFIRRFTRSLVRPQVTAGGVEFRVLWLPVSLISFMAPVRQRDEQGESLSLVIRGGALVRTGGGDLSFLVGKDNGGVRLTLRLAGSRPRLLGSTPSSIRKLFYRFTQAYIHRVATVRFLAGVHGELAGVPACVRIVPVNVMHGEEI
ncbi:hypothetical protein [Geobacter benzoatilyticus]|uniref:Uncharacterized protein n=1 Tax=Geobacter benzoatilyticus TaxID=2815309 RepID=A0ABX7Q798_9BACT|nr:hypothetical protein [Geobacter benzoatilyticus]QSV46845.1 hypothetical protein JZM60_06145 [Geobacter benzoatilyticus]